MASKFISTKPPGTYITEQGAVSTAYPERYKYAIPISKAQASFGGDLRSQAILSPVERQRAVQQRERIAAEAKLVQSSEKAKAEFAARDESLSKAEAVKAGFESEIRQKYGVSSIQDFERRLAQAQRFTPLAYNRMAQDWNNYVKEYGGLVSEAERHQQTGLTHGLEAEQVSQQYFGKTTDLPGGVAIPSADRAIPGMAFGAEARQLQAQSERALSIQPGTPAERLAALRASYGALAERQPYLVAEAERLRVVGQAAPFFGEAGYAGYEKRFSSFEKESQKYAAEAQRVESGLKAFEPYSATPERKGLVMQTAPLQIPSEGLAFLGGKAAELLPEKKGPDVYFDFFGEKRKLSVGSKEEVKGMLQRSGQVAGEFALTAGAFKAAKAVVSVPSVRISKAEARLISSPKLTKTTVSFKGTAVSEPKGLQRLFYPKIKKPFNVLIKEKKLVEFARPAEEVSPFSLKVGVKKGKEYLVEKVRTAGLTGKGTTIFGISPTKAARIKPFLKTEVISGKIGKQGFVQAGFPVETSIRAKTMVAKAGQRTGLQYVANIAGEAINKASLKAVEPYKGQVWQKILLKTSKPAKTGLKAAGVGKVGGVFTKGTQRIILEPTAAEVRVLAKPVLTGKTKIPAKPTPLSKHFTEKYFAEQATAYEAAAKEASSRFPTLLVQKTKTAPLTFGVGEKIAPAVIKAVEKAKPRAVSFATAFPAAAAPSSLSNIPESYSSLAKGLAKEQKRATVFEKPKTGLEKMFESSIVEGPKLGEYLGAAPFFAAPSKEKLAEKTVPETAKMVKDAQKTYYSQKPALVSKSLAKTAERFLTSERTKPYERATVAQKMLPAQAMRPIQRTVSLAKTAELIKPFTIPPLKPITRIVLFPFPSGLKKPTALPESYGFKVLVREAGKRVGGKWKAGPFRALTEYVLPKETALALGQKAVAGKAKRTFKIIPSFGKKASLVSRLPRFRPEMFIKKGRVFTERAKFAIDTYGELQEITHKGISSAQKRALSLSALTAFKKKRRKKRR